MLKKNNFGCIEKKYHRDYNKNYIKIFSICIIAITFNNIYEGYGGYKYFGAAKDLPGVRELF